MSRATPAGAHPTVHPGERGWLAVRRGLLLAGVALYALHFVHLRADFPHDSPWNDWSKYTDEGWYGDGAIRHFVLGHWFLPGDFNPAVAMPVWPLLLAGLFHFTGVSLPAARGLAVACFGVTLAGLYGMLRRPDETAHRAAAGTGKVGLAAPLAVFLAAASSFLFVFDRLAILEPLMTALAVLALGLAPRVTPLPGFPGRAKSSSVPAQRTAVWLPVARSVARSGALGLLLAAMLLTKPTAVAVVPAILFALAQRAKFRWRVFGATAAVPLGLAATVWAGYVFLLVWPHYRADFRYLFDANAYTGFQLEPLSVVILNTFRVGQGIGTALYLFFFILMGLAALVRPAFFRDARVPALLLWVAGVLLLLGYHNNLQPRYYVPLAVPVTALVALALEHTVRWAGEERGMRAPFGSRAAPRWRAWAGTAAVVAVVASIAVPEIGREMQFVRHPDYSFLSAARQIAAIVRATPEQRPWIVSVSGSDLTLMTGLPSIDDDFGTAALEDRLRRYRPGWYVAWNELDDDKMDAMQGLFRPVRVASIPAMDDPDRNLLILYRLYPAGKPGHGRQPRPDRLPRPLRSRSGQQPAAAQLRH